MMEFLLKWLLRHKNTEVTLRGYREEAYDYIYIRLHLRDGGTIYNIISTSSIDKLENILDNMYGEVSK